MAARSATRSRRAATARKAGAAPISPSAGRERRKQPVADPVEDQRGRCEQRPATIASPGRPASDPSRATAPSARRIASGRAGTPGGRVATPSASAGGGTARSGCREPRVAISASRRSARPGGRRDRARGRRRSPRRGPAGAPGATSPRLSTGSPIARAVAAGLSRGDRVESGPELVEGEPERVDVGGGARALAGGLLGRHVGERADDLAGRGQGRGVVEPGDAEVGEQCPLGGAALDAALRTGRTRTLSGLMSRWTTPDSWAWSRAVQSSAPSRRDRGR